MAASSDIIFYRYSPENMSEDILWKLFVGRKKLLESLVKEIENASKNRTPRFYLIIGPRGIGKSHFLTLLYYEIEKKLTSLLPIKLAEEEYSIYRASDLFLRILEENSEDISDILSLENEDEILHAALEKSKQISKRDDKNFIIFIENLHELFKQLDKEELHTLRSIFQKYDFFSVVATAPLIFPFISDHEEPFYNFFQIQHLKEFSIHEIKELMQKIATIENNMEFLEHFEQYEEKIHGIVHLTGGSPRLAFLFYEMITGGEIKNIEKAFFKIIDEHTPFYQEVFQLLTGQQRRIFDILISFGEPVTPKQISEKARIKLPTVNTQLRRLETNGYVISRPMGRHTKYEVRERLFRLWREMRQPFGRKRVSILLDFLRLWYTPNERKDLFKMTFKLLVDGEKSVIKDLCYYAEIQPHENRVESLFKLIPELLELGEKEEVLFIIKKLEEYKVEDQNEGLERKISCIKWQLLFSENKYEEALESIKKILEIDPHDDFALSNKGLVLVYLSKYKEALKTFNQALEINPVYDFNFVGKGIALRYLGKYEEALKSFNQALEINPRDETALINKAFSLLNLERYEEALKVANKVIDVSINYDCKKIALLITIQAYIALNRKAEAVFEIEKIESKMTDQDLDLINDFVEICFNLSIEELKDNNHGNAAKFIKIAFKSSSKLKNDAVKKLTITFLKSAADTGNLSIVKTATEEIIDQQKDELIEIIRPIIKAIEIVETKDLKKYYDLQIEEMEIVADVVKKIIKSEELIPDEIKKKEKL